MDIRVIFNLELERIELLLIFLHMSFGDYMYAFVFIIYLGVELLSHWVCMSSSRDPVIFGYILPS